MKQDKHEIQVERLYSRVAGLLHAARQTAVRSINTIMVQTYFQIGQMIVEEEQHGKERAEYGKQLMKRLSQRLQREFGKGFSVQNLENMRKFYSLYKHASEKSQSPIRNSDLKEFQLSWTHYLMLIRIGDIAERNFYEIEALQNNWSVRELKRNFDAALYQRLALSRDKDAVKQLSLKGHVINKPEDAIKEPYVLEFLGLHPHNTYTETELEQAIIDKIEHFLKELGKGFMFVSRQERISFEERHFYIDLVFYNRILRSFVLIDLKIGDLKHQDLGQMQMYVNYFDRFVKLPEENKTVGIVLCRDKSETLVEITLPEDNDQIFASRYKTVLPSKQALKRLLNQKPYGATR